MAFLEWLDPPFNGGHWNPELVALAGGIDPLGAPGQASSTLTWNQVADARADVVFVACCGLSVDRTRADLDILGAAGVGVRLPAVRNGRVFVADGNAYFSRPGPRLVDGLEMMAYALHPEVHLPSRHGSCVRVEVPIRIAPR